MNIEKGFHSLSKRVLSTKKFKLNVYTASLYTVISQIGQRYQVVARVEEMFNVLQSFSELEVAAISAKS